MGRAEKEPRRGFSVVVVKNEHGSQTYFELHHCLAQYDDLGHVSPPQTASDGMKGRREEKLGGSAGVCQGVLRELAGNQGCLLSWDPSPQLLSQLEARPLIDGLERGVCLTLCSERL